MKKLLVGVAAVVFLTIAGSVWWLYHSLDSQVASAIRRYGPEITGVPVSLSGAHVDPLDGRAALYGLVVGNPGGFKAKQALSLGEISMQLDIGSLMTDVIRIKELTFVKPEVTYEYSSAGSNLDVLQQNIERYVAQQSKTKKPRDSEPDKKLVIEHLYVKNGLARVSAEVLHGNGLSVPIPDLHLQGIGKTSNGTTAGEAMRQFLGSLVKQVGAAVTALDLKTAGKTIQKGVEAATKTIKDLFK
jgi:uncharacterized protein involved in outer membrane biogenesis